MAVLARIYQVFEITEPPATHHAMKFLRSPVCLGIAAVGRIAGPDGRRGRSLPMKVLEDLVPSHCREKTRTRANFV